MRFSSCHFVYWFSQRTGAIFGDSSPRTSLLNHDEYGRSNSSNVRQAYDEHCHDNVVEAGMDKTARKKLILASILCTFFMVGEIAGGALAHSLAIMTDAAHLLTDLASFIISLLALILAARPSTKRMSFGWYRAEVVGALVSVLLIWLVTGILVYLAVERIVQGSYDIDGKVMLITSALGVGVNLIMLFTLHDHGHSHNNKPTAYIDHESSYQTTRPHSHVGIPNEHSTELTTESHLANNENVTNDQVFEVNIIANSTSNEQTMHKLSKQNITVRAAFIHVVGDLLQSVGVAVAALIIYLKPSYKIVDPICTFVFSVLVLITTVQILRDALYVLMEATPKGLNFTDVKNALLDIPGVCKVHNLRIWSLTTNKTALSVHLAVGPDINNNELLKIARQLLRRRYQIQEVTIQVEDYVTEMADCHRCQEPLK